MRICYFGLYDPRYPRNAMLIRGLRAAGVEVVEVRESLRFGSTPSLRPASRTRRLAEQFRALDGALDAVVVPTFNQALVPLARGLAWGRRTPVVHDFMVSLWDTAVGDRGQRPRHPDSLCAAALRGGPQRERRVP
jgi:hypothetical protein